MLQWVRDYFREAGPMRGVLAAFSALTVLMAPLALVRLGVTSLEHLDPWRFTLLMFFPVMAPLALMTLLLDALMARVFVIDAQGAEQLRLRRIIFAEVTLAILLLLAWLPYFLIR